MGQFKPMVKMETTEPSVELKLKKGGKVVKKAGGGMMGSPMNAMPQGMPARGGMMGANSPMAPSLAMRRRAMRGMPAGAGPAGPVGGAAQMQAAMPMPTSGMKKGGKADMGQDKAMVKKAFKQHDMQEHKGGKGTNLKLKHGGKMAAGGGMHMMPDGKMMKNSAMKSGGMACATGGVVNGQGGYAMGGIINTESQGGKYRNTKMDTAKSENSSAKTGGVKLGNAGGFKSGGMAMVEKGGKMVPDFAADGKGKMKKGGMACATGGVMKSNAGGYKKGGKIKGMMDGGMAGDGMMGGGMMDDAMMGGSMYKKGGATKKAFAAGGSVNSGRAVAMPQGAKKPSQPVSTNLVAGTFKKGGKVAFNDGGKVDLSKGAYDKAIGPSDEDVDMAKSIRGFPGKVMGKVKSMAKDLFSSAPKADSVTKTKESVTVTPAKKSGGSVKC